MVTIRTVELDHITSKLAEGKKRELKKHIKLNPKGSKEEKTKKRKYVIKW